MDFIRPLLMPVLVVLIVSTIWCMGWIKQMETEIHRAGLPNARAMSVAQNNNWGATERP